MNLIAIPLLYVVYKYLFLREIKSVSWRFFAPFTLFLSSRTKNLQTIRQKIKYIFIEVFLIISALLTSTAFENEFVEGILISIIASLLVYLSIFDVFTYSVPAIVTRWGLILVVAINIFALGSRLVAKYLLLTNSQFLLDLGTISNLLGGFLIGLIFWIIIKVTKEKGLGLGDLDIVMIIGFTLGFPMVLSAFYYTLIVATIFGILLAIYLKRFKGLIIPFVPFLTMGFLLAMAFGSRLIFPTVI